MHKISDFLVKHCYTIFIVFLVLTGICAFLSTKVKINKDIYSYMPADSETSRGLAIMNDEFQYSDSSSFEMMLKGLSDEKKLEIKSEIESLEGVKSVEYNDTDEFNRGDYTRYRINVDASADSEIAINVYKNSWLKYRQEYEGAAAGQIHEHNGDVLPLAIAALAVGLGLIVLIVMSKSWVEPFLFLFAILLAVVANKGTNIIFPSVSHTTDSISAVLQMALSMDYAIMLSTRYRQEKAKPDCKDKKSAMRHAMRYSFGAISSSSLTTVVGLLVLILMSFTIGRDMGLVLSKGVVLSLVSIFTSLPALLLMFDKVIEKTPKKTLSLKMDWAGKLGYNLRHFALPVFLVIFIGSFFLKGSTAIDYTGSENNEITNVFDQTNQMALIYDNKMEDDVTKICNEYDAREDTVRVLCYGNTINESEKYNEIVPKINDLGSEKIETEDYLMKAIYYFYYRNANNLTMTLDEFVKFLQNDVFPDEKFSEEATPEVVSKINQFSYFTDQTKVNAPRTKAEIANILGVNEGKLDDLYVLYLAEQNPGIRLTLNTFANFVSDEILTSPEYSSMVGAAEREDLAKLRLFSNPNVTDAQKNSAELANLFGINQESLNQILNYHSYSTIETPTKAATLSELADFILNNQTILSELGISDAENYKAKLADFRNNINNAKTEIAAQYAALNTRIDEAVATLPEETQGIVNLELAAMRTELERRTTLVAALANREYSYSEIASLVGAVNKILDDAVNYVNNLESTHPELFAKLDEGTRNGIQNLINQITAKVAEIRGKLNLDLKLEQLSSIFKLYQVQTSTAPATASPRELVNFLLAHQNDEKLSGVMTKDSISRLELVQYIMNYQATGYTFYDLATTFRLDGGKLKLVYALYEYRHVNPEPNLSLKTLINFIDYKILPNPEYANRLGEDERSKLGTIAILMRAAEAGVQYNYDSLYRAILPLANGLEKNKLFLVYLYYGSLYDYDENWTLTLEQFIDFVNDKLLPDSRFASRIDDEMRKKVADGYKTIHDAKELLVGPVHNRALFETRLPAEGKETFTFLRELKEKLGPKNNVDYFFAGESAMAYEMSQTFSGEMNFITIITMLAIFAVVVCTFKSIFVSLLLVLVIQCAVYIVMAYLSITGASIYFIALIIVQAILMGATIDYAILFTSYYAENRKFFQLSRKDALIQTYNKSIHAILTSALILIIVTAVLGNFTTAIAGKICSSISLGTICATIIILVLLPALLVTLDRFIIKKKESKHLLFKIF